MGSEALELSLSGWSHFLHSKSRTYQMLGVTIITQDIFCMFLITMKSKALLIIGCQYLIWCFTTKLSEMADQVKRKRSTLIINVIPKFSPHFLKILILTRRTEALAKENGCTHTYAIVSSKYSSPIFDRLGHTMVTCSYKLFSFGHIDLLCFYFQNGLSHHLHAG